MKTDRATRGFTLIEILVVLALLAIIMAFTFPQIMGMLTRMRIEGVARESVVLLRAARLEAIKRNCYGVLKIDPAAREVLAFGDLDRNGSYDPTNAQPDIFVGRIILPKQLSFKDAAGLEGLASVEGFDNPDVPVALPDQQVMFKEDGSVFDIGAIRFADIRGNVLEINVTSLTSGKVEIRKHNGTSYVLKGEGAGAWTYH